MTQELTQRRKVPFPRDSQVQAGGQGGIYKVLGQEGSDREHKWEFVHSGKDWGLGRHRDGTGPPGCSERRGG